MGLIQQARAFNLTFTDFSAAWISLCAILALRNPEVFTWIGPSAIKPLLALLVFFMGMTAKAEDFFGCLSKPRPIAINFGACFFIVPWIAFKLAESANLQEGLLVGTALLGSVNGGSASNLFTLLAGGDVPLSVLMTTSTTIGAVFVMPFVAKLLIGAIVPVDAVGILWSAVQLVVLPILSGVLVNVFAPITCAKFKPMIPLAGMVTALPIIGCVVAGSADSIASAGLRLHGVVACWHLLCGIIGYALSALFGGNECERRTVAIEVSMKNAVLANVLAQQHFSNVAVQAPAAVSCIWCPIIVSAVTSFWKLRTWQSKAHKNQHKAYNGEWVEEYYHGA